MRLSTKILRATNRELNASQAWILETANVGNEAEKAPRFITCSKLIVATGQTSQPWLPSFPGPDKCGMPFIHSIDLGQAGQVLISNVSVTHVTVLGGSKSAHDTVYAFANAGKKVTWLIRRTGRGAMPMANSYPRIGPWSIWLEGLLMTRTLSWFGACPWSQGDGFGLVRWLLHGTAIGRKLVNGYFASMSASTLDQSGILQDAKTRVLVPDQSLMWSGTEAGILNYDTDIYQFVGSGQVQVVRHDIDHLDGVEIVLQDGQRIRSDAMICATGYNYGPSFPLEPHNRCLGWVSLFLLRRMMSSQILMLRPTQSSLIDFPYWQ